MLHKLQSSFMSAIYNVKSESNIFDFIQVRDDRTLPEQLSIYRGSVFGGLKNALAETYPVTKELVGDVFFNRMIGEFITAYPCIVQDLNNYGKELASFIKTVKQARTLPYLADIAQLEWFYNLALNSKIQNNNLHELSALTEEQSSVYLYLPQGSTLIQSRYPIESLWKAHQEKNAEQNLDISINLEDEESQNIYKMIVFKDENGVNIDLLNDETFYFLSQIESEENFINVCNLTLHAFSDVDMNIVFNNAIHQGWIQSYLIK